MNEILSLLLMLVAAPLQASYTNTNIGEVMKEYYCRVCGFNNHPDEFWEDDIPLYIICSCCGCESGNEDYTIESTKRYREKWINEGTNWFEPKEKPEKWDKEEQFKNIPQEFL